MVTPTPMLCLSAHDELYMIDLERVLYIQADDHYSQVFYTSGAHFMVPFPLARIEERLQQVEAVKDHMLRLGRKYIVNTRRLFRISTTRELLYLTDDHGENVSIHISKPVLRSLLDMMAEGDGCGGGNF